MIPYQTVDIPDVPPQAMQLHEALIALATLVVPALLVHRLDVPDEVVAATKRG